VSATLLITQIMFKNHFNLVISELCTSNQSIFKFFATCNCTIMGLHVISHDVKLTVIRLYELDLLDLEQSYSFSLRTFYHILKLWHKTGDVVKLNTNHFSHPCILDHEDVHCLMCLVADNPDNFLGKLLHLLKTICFISIHYSAIHNVLERANVSHRTSSILLLREMKNNVHNSWKGWQLTSLNSLGFSMRFLRTRGPQHAVMDGREKEGEQQRSRFSCVDVVHPPRHS